ncbi:dihydrolipoyl dehydrogenase [Kushneria indalinina]|uniref:Dihydrolipoamide dehydrogenase n=1 Tax=Kushneria indalinina DSM 14324 TaxID=1122140 RepID=A0A3D9DYN4_9GAMM|nr:dihydrolipoyl dehydrogenase [Kushneria indalinina]REC95902.1 dihydrolipoamide dehydrogenase [Kushneria indalinina DSM 14324]
MQERRVDVAIIGAGSAGLGAYSAARAHTDSVILIEGGPYGTTCARVGCMPSKLLIAAAETAHHVRDASAYGVHIDGDINVNGRDVMARVKRERDHFVEGVIDSVDNIDAEQRIRGHATFESPDTLLIDDHTRIHAERIVIATGSSPDYPGFLKAAGERLVTNDDIFYWDDLPESIAVFGPGVVGLELAQALSRLGVRVRMFGVNGTIGPISDPDIRDYADRYFNEEFYLDPEADTRNVAHVDDRVEVTFVERDSQREVTERFDYLLATTGRPPNIKGLDIDRACLRMHEDLPVFDRYTLQCQRRDGTPASIFIAGDANTELPLLHEASDEGHLAGDNAGRYPDIRAGHRRSMLTVVFTDPQIATTGQTWAEIEQRDSDSYAIGEVDFKEQGRARVMRQNHGLLRVYGEQGSGLFLGAEMFGPQAEHLAHLLAWCHQQRMTVAQMLEMPFYHPCLEEGLRTALRDLNAALRMGPAMARHYMENGPGS